MFRILSICVLVLMIGALQSCQSGEQAPGSKSSEATDVEAAADSSQYEYRAVCTEKEAHGGTEYVLSRWLDDKDRAAGFGKYHGDFKDKGHIWRLERRLKSDHDEHASVSHQ